MKKYLFLFIFAFSIFSLRAEELKDYKLEVGQFNKLKITDDVNVEYRCNPDSTGWIFYRGEEEFADAFIFSNDKGTLKIQVSTEDVDKPNLPTVYVYSDYLTEVENSSNYIIRVRKPAPMPAFKIVQIGNGKIEVSDVNATTVMMKLATGNGTIVVDGECKTAEFTMVGTGLIQADMLKSTDSNCKILGSGSIGCWATDKLEVFGIGTTKIYYKGEPAIKKKGGGKLFPLTAE